MRDPALLADIGRWMPLGALTILAVYCLASIDTTQSPYGLPEVVGVAATVAVHLWRRDVMLSIIAGTAVCLVPANWVPLPG